jgi:serine/threonine protein kinase
MKLPRECFGGKLGQRLGQGSFGSVWRIKRMRKKHESLPPGNWVLKVSELRQHPALIDAFKREIYFLHHLQNQTPQLVPRLGKVWECHGSGYQMMEHFDHSVQHLGAKQAQKYGLNGDKNVVFTLKQVHAIVDAVLRFDKHGIRHGDLKKGNLLQRNNGETVVVADFGFSSKPETEFKHGMMGFTANYGCGILVDRIATKRQVRTLHSLPAHLKSYLNRWQIWVDFIGGRKSHLVNLRTKKLKRIDGEWLAKLLDLPKHIIEDFHKACPEAPLLSSGK